MPLSPGEKVLLKTVMETQEVTVGGETISQEVEVGSVVHARPGPAVDGAEYIVLNINKADGWRWDAPIGDYDAGTVSDDPDVEPRWVANG